MKEKYGLKSPLVSQGLLKSVLKNGNENSEPKTEKYYLTQRVEELTYL